MWRIFSLLVVVCVVCLFSVKAQVVNEKESEIFLNQTSADILFVIDSPKDISSDEISLELIDAEGKTRSQISHKTGFQVGKKTYKFNLPLGDWMKTVDDDLVWHRLRYRIGNSQGIISISELLKSDFELRVAAAEDFRAGTNYRVRVRTLQPYTNLPVKDVQISGKLKLDLDVDSDQDELEIKAESKTDAEGFTVLDFKIPAEAKLDDDGNLIITGKKNGIVREIDEDLDESEQRGSVFLTADKPIYQPSQNLNVRGLYFDANQKAVSNAELEFKIYDEDDTVLFRETVKTSAFGIAAVSWKIPENAKLGSYHIRVEGEDEYVRDSIYFKVSRYDLPNFTVTPTPDKKFYLPNEKQAEITVRADYLFGKPVAKGKVRVVQEAERKWNYKEQKYDIKEKQKFEGETDAEGKFIAKFDLSADFKELLESDWKRFEDLNFAAYFTDSTTNKTEQKRFDIRLTKDPIHIYLLGNLSRQNPKLPVTGYVSTFYADGTPAVCDVEIRGKFEDDRNSKENIVAQIKTNQFGAGKFKLNLPPSDDDDFDLKTTARDGKSKVGTFVEDIDFNTDEQIKIESDKTIYKPNEPLKISILSTKKDALVYLDVVKDWSVIDSYLVKLKDGKAVLKIPYKAAFKGDLTISAYSDESERWDEDMKNSLGIIYPEQQNLKVDAKFTNAVYKPSEEASAVLSVFGNAGKAIESALGVVVFDKAVEERARTDAEFGSYFSSFYGLMGYSKSFGVITLKDLNELDLSKPIPADLQLAAEAMLSDNYSYPSIYKTERDISKVSTVFAEYFKKQFAPVEAALKNRFEKTNEYPKDIEHLRKILRENGIDLDSLRDPWGENYRVIFGNVKDLDTVTFLSAGTDKNFETGYNFSASVVSFPYFKPIGKKIDEAVKNYHARTNGYIRDYETLRAELARLDFDLRTLKDRWNRDYRIEFYIDRRNYVIRFTSIGENGVYQPNNYERDDFDVWTSRIDYFVETDLKISEILNSVVNVNKKPFPKNEAEFIKTLRDYNLYFDQLRDGYGNPLVLKYTEKVGFADKTVIKDAKKTITPVTQKTGIFTIYSLGKDVKDDRDNFEISSYSSILTEQSKDTNYGTVKIGNIATSGASGAIRGTVLDPNGAVVPSATVTATSQEDETKTYSAASNDDGEFLLGNLPSGKYKVSISATGFQTSVYTDIQVRSQNLVVIEATLEIGTVNSVVAITADPQETVNATESRIATINGQRASSLLLLKTGLVAKNKNAQITSIEENSTPRLREYFPETLLWSPEVITDKRGKAQIKFKLADNITTWKMYAIASTKDGRIGVTEKEIQAFQPFFVDLDPPKFLTKDDEIYLPTQIRNYTAAKQKVAVTMAKGDWFSFLNSANQSIEVAPNATENAVFGFRADVPAKDAKQRVTAIAAKDSDAIEKPVTVRPNGHEVVQTESKLFQNAASFDVNFPANALPQTQKAELKIYPNLMSHVAESIEGLLQRPYGCGEQTISSTYPNLMILKFAPKDSKLRQTAQKYLQKGYERLIGYQVADGGFSYWGGKDQANLALTAYAIRFLTDTKSFIEVDENIIKRAEDWLVKQQRADGSFSVKYYYEKTEDAGRTKLFTSYVARLLAMQKAQNPQNFSKEKESVLQKSLSFLKAKNAEIDEPYALALFALASFDAGNAEDAKAIVQTLEKLAISESDRVYWKLESNTPFYGWGTAGRIETTALVLQALIKSQVRSPQSAVTDDLISKGMMFLLKNKDRYGVWYSTQTTINVLDAFLAAFTANADKSSPNQAIQIMLNGAAFQNVAVPQDQITPIILDLSSKLNDGQNRVEIKSQNNSNLMAQVVANHYVAWRDGKISAADTNQSRQIRLDYKCDKLSAKIMEEVSCRVEAERVGFRGYGMLLAEIGVPPGADVDRESLEKVKADNWNVSRYDVLPDRIIFYLWAQAGGTKFDFKFKPRYGINAQTPASFVYDYYNEEAKATIAPLKFAVK